MENIKEVARNMSVALGAEVKEGMIVKLPTEDCSHMGLKWEVYAARCGELTVIAYDYGDTISVQII